MNKTAYSFFIFSVISTSTQAQPNEALIASLIRSKNTQAAYHELTRSNPTKADILFFQALVAKHSGELNAAAKLLDKTLIVFPNHLNARRERAHVLFLSKKFKLAERNFQELLDLDATPQMQNVYRGFIREIQRRKPFGISGYFAFKPSSNVNRGTENLIYDSVIGDFVIDPKSRATSGIGLQIGLTGFYRMHPNNKSQNILTWDIGATRYQESRYNSATATLRFSHERRLQNQTKLSFGPHYRYTWRKDSADNQAFGVKAALRHKLSPRDILETAVVYEYRKYFHQSHNTGGFANLSFNVIHQQAPNLSYTLGMDATTHSPNAQHAVYNGLKISGGLTKAWRGGYVTGLKFNTGFKHYMTDYPLAGKPRQDRFYGLSLSVQNNTINIKGFVPRVTCSYTNNTSNIKFYDHDVTECALNITKRF